LTEKEQTVMGDFLPT